MCVAKFRKLLFSSAMVSVQHLPDYFVSILREHCGYVFFPGYLREDCETRFLDHYEMYSGKANLTAGVEKAARLNITFQSKSQLSLQLFLPALLVISLELECCFVPGGIRLRNFRCAE